MTRIGKLYDYVRAHPRATLPFHDFERLLHAFGFVEVRQRGSHRCFRHPSCGELLVVQPRKGEAVPYQVIALLDIIAQHGLRLDQ